MPNDVFWAALGAAIGGGIVALFIVWLRWFFDRPLVKVEARRALWPDPMSEDVVEGITLTAINPHSKPVTISGLGFTFKGRRPQTYVITKPEPQPLPYELGGGKSLTELITMRDLIVPLKNSGRSPKELKWAWFNTQSGKQYRDKLGKNFIETLERAYKRL